MKQVKKLGSMHRTRSMVAYEDSDYDDEIGLSQSRLPIRFVGCKFGCWNFSRTHKSATKSSHRNCNTAPGLDHVDSWYTHTCHYKVKTEANAPATKASKQASREFRTKLILPAKANLATILLHTNRWMALWNHGDGEW